VYSSPLAPVSHFIGASPTVQVVDTTVVCDLATSSSYAPRIADQPISHRGLARSAAARPHRLQQRIAGRHHVKLEQQLDRRIEHVVLERAHEAQLQRDTSLNASHP